MAADNNLVLKTAAAITTTTTGSTVDFGSVEDRVALTYRAVVSVVSGTSPHLYLKIQHSDDDSNWYDLAEFPTISAVGHYFAPKVMSKKRYRRIYATVDGTSPSFTTAVDVVPEPHYDLG